MKKTLIIDMGPVNYRWLFAVTSEARLKQMKLKKQENGLYDWSKIEDIYIFSLMTYVMKQKNRFGVDEVVLAYDHGPYWRKVGDQMFGGDFKGWSGYKHGRARADNDDSGIDWEAYKKTVDKVRDIFDKATTFKVIDIKHVEADDIGFVLSEKLSNDGHEVIVHTVDHDWTYNMLHPNVKMWKTAYTSSTKKCGFVDLTNESIERDKYFHCITGDPSDYIPHCKAYTKFSKEFEEEYPDFDKTPIDLYEKRHEVDMMFAEKFKEKYPEKYNKGALKAFTHPRFGRKTFENQLAKGKITLESFLEENPIHKMNYEMNAKIGLPEGICDGIRKAIIDEYNKQDPKLDVKALQDFFIENNMLNMIGKIGLF